VFGNRCTKVLASMLLSTEVEDGKEKDRKGSAKLGPVCEVPWRRIRVLRWVEEGAWM
jgi:hypothetical protein